MARGLGLALVLLLLSAPAASALTEPSGELVAGAEETVLRLHDLPPGYQVDDADESRCFSLNSPGETSNRLVRRYTRWVLEHRPEGCSYLYERIFEVPGLGPAPPEVEALTVNTPSEGAADSGLELLRGVFTFVRFEKGEDRGEVSISPSGAPARLVRFEHELVGEKFQPASILFWRHGKLIAVVQAAGLNPRRNDRAALRFAQIQQERLEHPSPYTEAERDDTEVWLDDPSLKFPIYWVGRRFAPGQGLPESNLGEAFTGAVGLPGRKATLWYDGFNLAAWTHRSWKGSQPTVLDRLNLKRACVRKTEVLLEQGNAVVYSGYRRRHLRSCPKQPPDDYWAIAHLGRMVIGVNLLFCRRCLEHGDGPYDSLAGMKAIIGALTLRPKPVY